MSYALLRYQDSTLTPEARWLLWRWARCIGLDQSVDCSVRELLKRLAMTSRQGQPALNLLNKEGAIIRDSKPVGRGRPSYEYRLSPELLEYLAENADAEPVLGAEIDRIGDPANDMDDAATDEPAGEQEANEDDASPANNLLDGETRHSRLTLSNRWVLMVLLAHANENGTVMDMPDLHLQKLTGLSPNRWRSQRRKLHDLGMLARYQRGRPAKWNGQTLPVVHHLNLGHPYLSRPSKPVVQVVLRPSHPIQTDTSRTEASVTALLLAAHSHCDTVQRDRYQRAKAILPERQYTAIEWAVVRALPNTYGVMAWLRGHVHWAMTQLLNTAWDDIRDRHAATEAPVAPVIEKLEQALDHPLITLGAEALQAQWVAEQGETTSTSTEDDQPRLPLLALDYRVVWANLLYALAYDLARFRQIELSDSHTLISKRGIDPSRLTYSFTALTPPTAKAGPSGKEPSGKENHFWLLCGYADQHDDSESPAEPPVVIAMQERSLPKRRS
ncbi:hypothetical protein HNO51_17565 [Billgrantia sulfidoxydans]|uniref:Uncharacterized protein n=1 Tax=Billgrantia sulfidoxydans TaxID=2733484 RepID=A0ABX7W7I2_9GAMM|nr:hypothetical protein [Halomonas sulfidoxydans]QTP56333.1 hypothetical protein HNO51_17565 [Halomonas sulfidoxydans]